MKKLFFASLLLFFAISNLQASGDSYNIIIHVGEMESVGENPNNIPHIPISASYNSEDAVVSFYFDYPLGDGMLIVSSAVSSDTQTVEFNSVQTRVDVSLIGYSGLVRLDIYTLSGFYYTFVSV
ncbi:MAG: hypothetical protein IJ202_09245 [Bacteroidales bacterium]|nr:hypothetical protein [Bacteroidales bacterium]